MNRIRNRYFSAHSRVLENAGGRQTHGKMIDPRLSRAVIVGMFLVFVSIAGILLIRVIYPQIRFGFDNPNLLNWAELLIIPTILVSGALLLNRSIRSSEQRAQNDLKVAQWYAQHEREIEAERFRETAVQIYLDRMTELLLEKELRSSEPGTAVRDIARARTLTVLRGLDGPHKGLLLRFLYETGLIKSSAVIDLHGADLRGADLKNADLHGVNLRQVDLSGANLEGANLSGSDLHGASLVVANLSRANLRLVNLGKANLAEAVMERSDLDEAHLSEADFHGANLEGANLHQANLIGADLSETILILANLGTANLHQATMYRANLNLADLSKSNLTETNLSWTQLCGANLGGADLVGASMHGANLEGANVIGSTLGEVKSLKRAIMPDGKRHH